VVRVKEDLRLHANLVQEAGGVVRVKENFRGGRAQSTDRMSNYEGERRTSYQYQPQIPHPHLPNHLKNNTRSHSLPRHSVRNQEDTVNNDLIDRILDSDEKIDFEDSEFNKRIVSEPMIRPNLMTGGRMGSFVYQCSPTLVDPNNVNARKFGSRLPYAPRWASRPK